MNKNTRNSKENIVAVHLLNDYSGSPNVLRQAITAWVQNGHTVDLYTATPSGKGMLSEIPGVTMHRIFYRWHPRKWMTLFYYMVSQVLLFLRLLVRLHKNDKLYINSLLPFGAALAGWLRGVTVCYHFHEVSVKPALLKHWLLLVANTTASRGVFVSEDLRARLAFRKKGQVIYNTVPEQFIEKALCFPREYPAESFTVLMVCSLKKYKGVLEFAATARQLPHIRFRLVLNAQLPEIETFFRDQEISPNLEFFPAASELSPFYETASVVLNLSRPDEWIETFGMTILEAMYYGLPVIVPPAGGVLELVTDGREGFRIDSSDSAGLAEAIQQLASDAKLYQSFAANARRKACGFNPARFSREINAIVSGSEENCISNLTSGSNLPFPESGN